MIVFWILVILAVLGIGGYLAMPLLKTGARAWGVAAGCAAPATALALYFLVGSPWLATLAHAPTEDEGGGQIEAAIAQLAAAVSANPQDEAAWRQLASARLAVGDYPAAVDAFQRLIALVPDDASLQSAYGEALVLGRGGVVTPEAKTAFETARAGNADDVRAAFYLAEAKYQAGLQDEAIADWGALATRAPPDAPWLAIVGRRLARAAQMQERSIDALGLPEDTVAALEAAINGQAAPQRGPSQQDVANAADMTDEQRAAMVEGMVGNLAARLEQNPDDIDGWTMLARSYRQLGRDEDALDALRHVTELAPDDLEAFRNYVYSLWVARTDADTPDAETTAALEDLHARDAADPVARLGLAEAAQANGDAGRARTLFTGLVNDETAPEVLRNEALRQLGAMEAEAEAEEDVQ